MLKGDGTASTTQKKRMIMCKSLEIITNSLMIFWLHKGVVLVPVHYVPIFQLKWSLTTSSSQFVSLEPKTGGKCS